jgi:hypothetical protein
VEIKILFIDSFILFRDWLKMLRQNGKFLYVITGEILKQILYIASLTKILHSTHCSKKYL